VVRLCRQIDISVDWLLLGRGHMDGHHRFSVDAVVRRLVELLRSLPRKLVYRIVLLVESIAGE
jgi:hypothetical protein